LCGSREWKDGLEQGKKKWKWPQERRKGKERNGKRKRREPCYPIGRTKDGQDLSKRRVKSKSDVQKKGREKKDNGTDTSFRHETPILKKTDKDSDSEKNKREAGGTKSATKKRGTTGGVTKR